MMAVHLRTPDHMVVHPDRIEAHFFGCLGRFDDVLDAGQRAGIGHAHAKGNLVHFLLLLLFSDFDFVILQVAVVPVDHVGGDIVEIIVVNAVVGGFLVKHQFLRLTRRFV